MVTRPSTAKVMTVLTLIGAVSSHSYSTCQSGKWVCTTHACPGLCTNWGESHYKTFDGRSFDFHGNCDYMLAKGESDGGDADERFTITAQVPCFFFRPCPDRRRRKKRGVDDGVRDEWPDVEQIKNKQERKKNNDCRIDAISSVGAEYSLRHRRRGLLQDHRAPIGPSRIGGEHHVGAPQKDRHGSAQQTVKRRRDGRNCGPLFSDWATSIDSFLLLLSAIVGRRLGSWCEARACSSFWKWPTWAWCSNGITARASTFVSIPNGKVALEVCAAISTTTPSTTSSHRRAVWPRSLRKSLATRGACKSTAPNPSTTW